MESIQEFKIGDVVRITRKYKTHQDGWRNSWGDDMDQFVGTAQTIESIDTRNKQCCFKDVSFGWPLAVLELVNRPVFADTNWREEGVGEALPAHVRDGASIVKLRKPTAAEMAEFYGVMPPAKKPEIFVLPSDEAGIEAMLVQPKSAPPAAPAPQKAPFYKGLLIQASEKYMGLGFNGEK